MKKELILIVLITGFLFSCTKVKEKETAIIDTSTPKPLTINSSRLDSLFNDLKKNGEFMGSIALSHNGKIIYKNAVGYADFETKKKATTNTKYRIGSISKVFTSSLVFKAIEEAKLTMEQTIEGYFPNIVNADQITIENLLHHRSGIHSLTNEKDFFDYHTQYKSREELVEIISGFESDFEPNSTGNYSNSNYILLSLILEKIYDTSLKDLIAEKISSPLNLDNTYYGSKISIENNESHSYKYEGEHIKQPETDMSIPMGAGAIVSTPSDLTKFIDGLFSGKIISQQNIEKMTTIKDRLGLGIFNFPFKKGRESFGHGGNIDGFNSFVTYFPEFKLAIALTSNEINRANNHRQRIVKETLDAYFNDPVIEISTAELTKYVGIYSAPELPGKMVISQDKNKLFAQITGLEKEQPNDHLVYSGGHKFSIEEIGAGFTFKPELNQFILKQGDSEIIFAKE